MITKVDNPSHKQKAVSAELRVAYEKVLRRSRPRLAA
jgi:hypothetical protein